ncbi:hypothetical protein V2G26_000697 [Clonostachys chloroleuca]
MRPCTGDPVRTSSCSAHKRVGRLQPRIASHEAQLTTQDIASFRSCMHVTTHYCAYRRIRRWSKGNASRRNFWGPLEGGHSACAVDEDNLYLASMWSIYASRRDAHA